MANFHIQIFSNSFLKYIFERECRLFFTFHSFKISLINCKNWSISTSFYIITPKFTLYLYVIVFIDGVISSANGTICIIILLLVGKGALKMVLKMSVCVWIRSFEQIWTNESSVKTLQLSLVVSQSTVIASSKFI